MISRATELLTVVLLVSLAAIPAYAQEFTTDAEQLYREARRSDDHTTQLLADRWNGLVRLQTWTDTTGQFEVTAKYVEHDPDMKWVKLRAVKGSGGERVVKDLKVPLEKLDKMGQSRVRQIAFVRPKLEEAMAAAAQAAEEADDQQGGPAEAEDMFAPFDEQSLERGQRGGPPPGLAPPGGPPPELAPPGGPPPPPGAGMPMLMPFGPMAFPTTPMSPPQGPPTAQAGDAASPGDREAAQSTNEQRSEEAPSESLRLLSSEAWTRDYDDFRSRFLVNRDGIVVIQGEDGPLSVLRELYAEHQFRTVRGGARTAPPDEAALAKRLQDEVGEFVWEAELAGAIGEQNNWTELLRMPPLPEPVTLTLLLDEASDQGHWRRFQKGARVRFVGHFTGFSGPHGLVAAIRFPENQPTAEKQQPTRR